MTTTTTIAMKTTPCGTRTWVRNSAAMKSETARKKSLQKVATQNPRAKTFMTN